MKGINPALFTWARERKGLTVQEVANRTGISITDLTFWEEGEMQPAYSELERLADLYGVPTATFFFPEPPEIGDDPMAHLRGQVEEAGPWDVIEVEASTLKELLAAWDRCRAEGENGNRGGLHRGRVSGSRTLG